MINKILQNFVTNIDIRSARLHIL